MRAQLFSSSAEMHLHSPENKPQQSLKSPQGRRAAECTNFFSSSSFCTTWSCSSHRNLLCLKRRRRWQHLASAVTFCELCFLADTPLPQLPLGLEHDFDHDDDDNDACETRFVWSGQSGPEFSPVHFTALNTTQRSLVQISEFYIQTSISKAGNFST